MRGNATLESFNTAKKHVYVLSQANPRTFYCGCSFLDKRVMAQTCGYVPAKPGKRSERVEVEHIVPAAVMGAHLPEWQKGHRECVDRKGERFKGRNCARKMSPLFRKMESDLYNLQPVIGELNAVRKDATMGKVAGEVRRFGACDVEIQTGTLEPAAAIQGDVARTWLYMEWAYPGWVKLSGEQRKLYEEWSAADPVDASERARARAIGRIQGNENPFVR